MPDKAHLIITGAKVFTADPVRPTAEAVAVRGKRIVFAGSNADALEWRGPDTRFIEGQGHTLMPGFIDSHFHLMHGSLALGDAQLYGATSLEEVGQVVRAFAAENRDVPWVVGRGLKYRALPNQTVSRQQLDTFVSDRPLVLMAYDVHTAWANSAAFEAAGILRGGELLGPNSEIVMAPDGTASGELREPGAYNHVFNLVPQPDSVRQRTLLREGLALTSSLGVTSVHNMDGGMDQLALYAALEDLGELPLRILVPFDVEPDTEIDALTGAVQQRELYNSEFVSGGMVKFFMDGVIESYTALLLSDYNGHPGNRGGALFEVDHFSRMALEADRLGLQIAVHAVGDGAVRRALDGFEEAQRVNGLRDSRHRIEHIEVLHPDDAPRFKQLGVTASMQPMHASLTVDDDIWTERVGPARWDDSFAWRSVREAGSRLVFGSDWPVVSQNPFEGLYYALNRQAYRDGGPDQRQTLEEALLSYTRDAAWAEFQEDVKGQLKAGMLADMVLVSEDLFALPPAELTAVRPALTVCDGRIVFEA